MGPEILEQLMKDIMFDLMIRSAAQKQELQKLALYAADLKKQLDAEIAKAAAVVNKSTTEAPAGTPIPVKDVLG